MLKKSHWYKLLLSSPLLFCTPATFAQDEPELPNILNESRDAVAITREPPSYPLQESRRGKEGIVTVSFIIDENGEVQNAMIEDAIGSEGFESASLQAVNEFVYEPAMVNGEPVSQSMTRQQFRYILSGQQNGANRSFINEYNKIMELITSADADKDEINNLITELKYSHVNNLYEAAWYALMKSNYLNKFEPENRGERITNLNTAIMIKTDTNQPLSYSTGSRIRRNSIAEEIYLPPDYFIRASQMLLNIHLQESEFSQAMRVYDIFTNAEQLQESPLYEEVSAYFSSTYEQIIERIDSDEVFFQPSNIGTHEYWVLELLRPSFSIEDVSGTLSTIDIRCSNRNAQFDFIEDQVWNIPASWGLCSLYLKGEEDTSFTFYSIP